MNDEAFKENLRRYALDQDIDMLGFAHIDRFKNAPSEFDPRNIYPRVRTVVVIGIRVLRGLMESLDNNQHIPYNAHGYGGINEQFMRTARQRVAQWIEDHGFSAVPVIQWTGTPHQEPIMCHRTAAVAAGLGEFGWSKVFLTKRFGPLQRLGVVLTDADLPSDPLQIGQICDHCMACAQACPAGAIARKESRTVEIASVEMQHGKVDIYKCTKAHHAGTKETHPRPKHDFDISDIDRKYETMLRDTHDDTDDYVLGVQAATDVQERYPDPLFSLVSVLGRSLAFCGARGCFRACLAHLEARGLLDREFAHAYRALTKQQGRPKSVGGTRKSQGKVVNIE